MIFDRDDVGQLRREMRAQDARRYTDPDADAELQRVVVAYVWRDGAWVLAGFRHCWPRALGWRKAFRRLRRRLRIARDETMALTSLDDARRHGPPRGAPSFKPSTRRERPSVEIAAPRLASRSAARRFTRDRSLKFDRKTTRYVAVRRVNALRCQYLAPLAAVMARDARREALALFGAYAATLEVHAVADLPKRVRRKLRNGQHQPGAKFIMLPSDFIPSTLRKEIA